jgi:hypothetical protein
MGYKTARLELDAVATDVGATNVVALLRGSDPSLADEAILVHAAYDRLDATRSGEEGAVRPGAVAAGDCAVLLELAEALAADPPARSVVFALTTASLPERYGLGELAGSLAGASPRVVAALSLERLAAGARGAGEDDALRLAEGGRGPIGRALADRGLELPAPAGPDGPRPPRPSLRTLGRAGLPAAILEGAGAERRGAAGPDRPDALDHATLAARARTVLRAVRLLADGGV